METDYRLFDVFRLPQLLADCVVKDRQFLNRLRHDALGPCDAERSALPSMLADSVALTVPAVSTSLDVPSHRHR